MDGNRAYVWLFMFLFSLLSCFSFWHLLILIFHHHSILVYSYFSFCTFSTLPCHLMLLLLSYNVFWIFCYLCFAFYCFSFLSFSVFWHLHHLAYSFFLFTCPVLSLSQITVSVAQGRVRSPSPQPRYKSYAYTQAAYVKSPEQKRRRFTDQVRGSIPCQMSICLCMFWLFWLLFCLPLFVCAIDIKCPSYSHLLLPTRCFSYSLYSSCYLNKVFDTFLVPMTNPTFEVKTHLKMGLVS